MNIKLTFFNIWMISLVVDENVTSFLNANTWLFKCLQINVKMNLINLSLWSLRDLFLFVALECDEVTVDDVSLKNSFNLLKNVLAGSGIG